MFQSYKYLREAISRIGHGFRCEVNGEGERAKRKVNKLLKTEEKLNYKSLPAGSRMPLASAKEKISLVGVVLLEFIQGDLKYLY